MSGIPCTIVSKSEVWLNIVVFLGHARGHTQFIVDVFVLANMNARGAVLQACLTSNSNVFK